MSEAISVTNLTKQYGEFTAVAGISLSLNEAECLALLGPNGAGKTTTVEILEGLQQPTSGEVKVLGKSLDKERRDTLEKIGVLLQETYMYKKLTVRETLSLFASFYKKAQDPEKIIRLMRLEDKADVRLEKLSGGQKQRVYLGCTLINDPELLFLDEPTTGLDPQARRMIWDLLADLKKERKSILLTTHYMDEAEYLADRVAIIDHGKIITTGTPKQLIKDACGEQMITLDLEDRDAFAALKRQVPVLEEAKEFRGGYELGTDEGAKLIKEISAAAQTNGFSLKTLQMRNSTLEDVFLQLTGRSIRDE